MIVTHNYFWYKLGETEQLFEKDGFFFLGVAEGCLQAFDVNSHLIFLKKDFIS